MNIGVVIGTWLGARPRIPSRSQPPADNPARAPEPGRLPAWRKQRYPDPLRVFQPLQEPRVPPPAD